MRVMPVVKNLTEPEAAQFHSYLAAKLERLKPMLESRFPDEDQVKVDARIRKHERHSAFQLEMVFNLPRGKFMSTETKHSITEVLDFTTDRLETQLTRHFKKLTRE